MAWTYTKTSLDSTPKGATAEYFQVDVTSGERVRAVVDEVISKHGRITGVIHGAGIEDSTPFESKSEATVNQVLDVKVSGWRNLQLLKEANQDLRFACSFTSVSGRLGNATQLGYCAANRILDAEHSRINKGGSRRFRLRGLHGRAQGWQLEVPWRQFSKWPRWT